MTMLKRLSESALPFIVSMGAPALAWSHPGHAPLAEGLGGYLHAVASMDHLLIPAALLLGAASLAILATGKRGHRALAALCTVTGLGVAVLAAG